MGLIVVLTTENALDAWIWAGAYLLCVISPVVALLVQSVRTLRVESFEVPVRQKRGIFYSLGILGMLVFLVLIELGHAPVLLKSAVIAAILTNSVAITINQLFTKISVHAAAIAGCTAVLLPIVSPFVFAIFCMVTVLQGWARIRLNRHTLPQVVLGWAVAAISVALVLSWSL